MRYGGQGGVREDSESPGVLWAALGTGDIPLSGEDFESGCCDLVYAVGGPEGTGPGCKLGGQGWSQEVWSLPCGQAGCEGEWVGDAAF